MSGDGPKALWIRDLDGFAGHAALYRLTPPLDGHALVVVSAAVAMLSGGETYIFPADGRGQVTRWGELEGSYQGDLDHGQALEGAGYTPARFGWSPAWATEAARSLAAGMLAESAWDRSAILADALEEVGCDDGELLAWLRSPDYVGHADEFVLHALTRERSEHGP